MTLLLNNIYRTLILQRAGWTLISIALAIGSGVVLYAADFKLDASADSLLLEDDADLKYYREVSADYESEDFLVVTYTSAQDIFAPESLQTIRSIKSDLLKLEGIDEVLSLLDVPLFKSPPIPFSQLSETSRTLESPDADHKLARREFLQSPLYQELLLSKDGRTAAMIAYLKPDERYRNLLNEREQLRELAYQGQLNAAQERRLREVEQTFRSYQPVHAEREREHIRQVREVLEPYKQKDTIFLGGAPMIVADMISFIRDDLVNFGVAIILFLIVILGVIFKQPRWVLLPLMTCGLAVAATFAVLGLLDWRITVISANFASLLLIITMSMTIHIVVRYRETQTNYPQKNKTELIGETMRFMLKPCFYTSLTTAAAFVSLYVSGIRPVIDFGHIMTVGIGLAFVLTFLALPSALTLLPKGVCRVQAGITHLITLGFANFTHRHYVLVIGIALSVVAASIGGILQLQVENRFIDYFKDDTEIHRGMLKIDRELGGTIPLDVIINAPVEEASPEPDADDIDDWEDDLLGDYLDESEDETQNLYWLTPRKFEEIKKLHAYFEAQSEIGKVISLATLINLSEQLNENQPLSDLQAPLLSKFLPAEIKKLLLKPYLSEDANQLRFTMRITDSNPQLRRQELLERINNDLLAMGYDETQFRPTGMLVLYNNMLQSLYQSQILTLGMVFLAILLMFTALFRSLLLAVIAIIPNLLAAGLVLGFMGWSGIPLDMMTITIAAISIGIAVDNTIHYIVRFKREFVKDCDHFATVKRCHGSIGKAVYYTSSVIIIGFAILSLSNFIPSVYFGLLVGLAMFAALIATLSLLPALLLVIKPLRPATPLQSTTSQ